MRRTILFVLLMLCFTSGLLLDGCSVCLKSSKCKTPGQRAALEIFHISTGDQRKELRSLTDPDEVDQFLEKFWVSLDPTPGTPENEFREQYYRRYNYANSHFNEANIDGSRSDQGRVYILYGPPDEVFPYRFVQHNSDRHRARAFEVWQYDVPSSRSKNTDTFFQLNMPCMTFVFADEYGIGSYTQIYSTEIGEVDDASFIRALKQKSYVPGY